MGLRSKVRRNGYNCAHDGRGKAILDLLIAHQLISYHSAIMIMHFGPRPADPNWLYSRRTRYQRMSRSAIAYVKTSLTFLDSNMA